MVEGLDMTLDDLIEKKKSTKKPRNTNLPPPVPRAGRSGGRDRRFLDRRSTRTTPYTSPHHKEGLPTWKYMKLYGEGKSEGVISKNSDVEDEEGEAKLYVSNLHYEVSNNDIKVLFSDVGELKRYGIHYDRSGRSKGSAEVEFVRKSDAMAAMRRYNNSRLDGERMYIELIGSESVPPRPPSPLMPPNVAHQQMPPPPPPIPPNVAHQQMPPPVPPPVTNWQMVYAVPSNVVTHQPMAPPMPPTVAHWQITPMPQTVPDWQSVRGFGQGHTRDSVQGFGQGHTRDSVRGFGQGHRPDKRHAWVPARDPRADMEKHVKWKHGSRSQGNNQGQKPQGKQHGKVSADDLDADLDKYLSKRKKIFPIVY